ncbi:MAG: wax ester/triacylglycerol synthase family O-acyltransferase [Candidatus Binatia bacterium]|nr:wax ester/triacylglycerol synthase family O-acyltransferase [Candidatus Binatia bacterium]
MARSFYERLTALDSSFLLLEKHNSPLHVASTLTIEAEPLRTEGGGIDAERIKKHMASELHRIPRYRQKLRWIPLTSRPVWVDDDRFNIDYHVRHTSLPRPGSDEQLKRLSARIMEQPLDPSRPLWETWIVEGLDGDRFALISKVHHCMIDGVSGVDLLKILLSPTPEVHELDRPRFLARRAPSPFELWRDEMLRRAFLPLQLVNGVRALVSEAEEARRETFSRLRSAADMLGSTLSLAPETPLNQPVSPHRRFDWLTMELEEVKQIRRAFGCSINDVVLAVVTGAMQRFLERRNLNPAAVDFKVMSPVSVRSEDQQGALGNQVSAWILELPIGEVDPREQIRLISARTNELKEKRSAVGATVLTDAAEWGSSTLLALGARNVSRFLPFNLVVTNVPGPQFPMYMLGAKLQRTYPLVPLVDNMGLGLAQMSYDGKLCWGFNADYDLLPDLPAIVRATQEAFDELKALAASGYQLSPESPAEDGAMPLQAVSKISS